MHRMRKDGCLAENMGAERFEDNTANIQSAVVCTSGQVQ